MSFNIFSTPLFSFVRSYGERLEDAKQFLIDQQQEKAIEFFLSSLDPSPSCKKYYSSIKEKMLYQKALALYVDAKGAMFRSFTDQIIFEFAPIVKEHPEYAELAFIVASAYANRGEFLLLFDLFYNAYYQHPKHYFASKIQGILWIKLFERTLPGPLKEIRRDQILKFLSEASESNSGDTALYKLRMLYAPDKMHSSVVNECLNKIINKNIILPVGELEFFIEMAFELNDSILTRRFIDKASGWYPNSRILARAKQVRHRALD